MNVDPGMGMDTLQNPSNMGAILRLILSRYLGGGQMQGPQAQGPQGGQVDPGFNIQRGATDGGGAGGDLLGAIQHIMGTLHPMQHPGAVPARTGTGGIHGTPPHAPSQGYAPGGVNYMRPKPAAPSPQDRMRLIAQRFGKNTGAY